MGGGIAGLSSGGLFAFLYWIFFGLCKLIYGAIPGLYDAFEFFGKIQFFDLDNDIKKIWGNLYVLLSVLVLFAIAIKLINAIVNPDVLSDKKKGVKRVYFKAFVAVFLTILTPYMFTLLVHVQENIFDNKTIEKIFFNSPEGTNSGKVIAWTAITSFIDLSELADATAETDHAYNLDTSGVANTNSHIYVLSEDIDTGLNNIYKSQPWQYTDTVSQNPILMLLAGAFIVYEFVLLVMDTALRSIKLGLLQMMTPIILGAYIFKDDILKKWVLEYIKTFIQIFLLLIAITLMTKVLSLLPNILVSDKLPDNPSWLLKGIINTLAIIATLRLVKQIVPLINKIFGVNIQEKGGIKGRLGEMAAVGGLAQKAWGALGTGAKNLAKLGAASTLALPLAAGAGINGLYKARHNGRSLTETKGFRGIKGVGSGLSTALKTGNWKKAAEAGFASYDKIETAPWSTPALDKAKRVKPVNDNINNILTNPKTGNSYTSETNIANKLAANKNLNSNVSRLGGSKVEKANANYQNKNLAASITKSIDSDNNSITTLMESAMGNYEVGSSEQVAIATALDDYKKSGSTSDLRNWINGNRNLFNSATLDNLIGENGKLASKERKVEYALNNLTLTAKERADLGRGEAAISFLAKTLESSAGSAKTDLDIALEGARLTANDRMEVDRNISAMTDVNNSMAFAIGRTDSENGLSRGAVGGGASSSGGSSGSTSSGTSGSTSGGTSGSSSGGGSTSSNPQPEPAPEPSTPNPTWETSSGRSQSQSTSEDYWRNQTGTSVSNDYWSSQTSGSPNVVYETSTPPGIMSNAPEVNLGTPPSQNVTVNQEVHTSNNVTNTTSEGTGAGNASQTSGDSGSSNNNNNNSNNSSSSNDNSDVVEALNKAADKISRATEAAGEENARATREVTAAVNTSEKRQKTRQEEILDAMGGHGMRSEDELRNDHE